MATVSNLRRAIVAIAILAMPPAGAVLAAPQTTTATQAADPLTTAARIFHDRMAAFREENRRIDAEDATTNTGYIVLLGDSITQGFPQQKLLSGLPVVNRGISSDQVGDADRLETRGVVNRLAESVWECRPLHVFVLIGVNDIGAGIKGDRLEKRHADLLNGLMEGLPATSITLQTILPARGRFARLNGDIADANQRLARLADERGINLLDTAAALRDEQGHLREDFTSDGLHLNAKANEVWAKLLLGELDRLGFSAANALGK